MVMVTVLYVTMGVLGYLTFGDQICGSITLNLPEKAIYATVKMLYTAVIFVSFAVQFYVPITFLWPPIKVRFKLAFGLLSLFGHSYIFDNSSPKSVSFSKN